MKYGNLKGQMSQLPLLLNIGVFLLIQNSHCQLRNTKLSRKLKRQCVPVIHINVFLRFSKYRIFKAFCYNDFTYSYLWSEPLGTDYTVIIQHVHLQYWHTYLGVKKLLHGFIRMWKISFMFNI